MKQIENIYAEIQQVAEAMLHKGWAERNAGNFSLRIDPDLAATLPEFTETKTIYDKKDKDLANEHISLLISHSGAKCRDIAKNATQQCGLLESKGGKLTYLSHAAADPSSEFLCHLAIHRYISHTNPQIKVVLHTHPTHLIAFSHKYQHLAKYKMNKFLTGIMPELNVFIPKDIGTVKFLPPGSLELAKETIGELKEHDIVIWQKHGCLAVAETLWDAFDLIDIADKAAQIALYL
ncbi:MAG: rhamnulose-1-phosphate aldolase [Candidatus Cloacimonetes bacterium]|nr:rhamnulose-1-phosphate aldolase [Candidatus Cloacimonadota bacterium]